MKGVQAAKDVSTLHAAARPGVREGFLHRFGCRMSAMACTRTTHAVVWILEQDGHSALCYFDDFACRYRKRAREGEGYVPITKSTSRVFGFRYVTRYVSEN